ncbi:MAG: MerR family transcriptional regulator [Nannocystaceae bacterium]|nr:MerR family transcriptional regulator [Nannocystaceae bacterium]
MLSIGEFSRATALTVKTLRHYHERGVLVPTHVEPGSGYRYYDEVAIERAGVIKALRELEFSLDDIGQILSECADDADALQYLAKKREAIAARMAHLRSIAAALESVIRTENDAKAMNDTEFEIEDKTIAPVLIAGIRIRGRFEQCKDVFKQLGRAFGFGLAGKPGMLIYDEEYKQQDADFEPFFPVKKSKKTASEIHVRELPGGRALCLVHRGPYDRIASAYGRLLGEARQRRLVAIAPSREVYLKGPGMLFAGNPEKYLTEVQIFVRDGE